MALIKVARNQTKIKGFYPKLAALFAIQAETREQSQNFDELSLNFRENTQPTCSACCGFCSLLWGEY
jgi:hypothetical protein